MRSHKKKFRTKNRDWSPGTTNAESIVLEPPQEIAKVATHNFSGLFEHRDLNRISERELSAVKIAIRLAEKSEWIPVKLWDFNSISFGIHIPNQPAFVDWTATSPHMDDQNLSLPLNSKLTGVGVKAGDQIEIQISVNQNQKFEIWCEVKNSISWKNGIKLGLRRLDVNFPQTVKSDRREADRLSLAPSVGLKARLLHPFIFGHWCTVQVFDLNKNMGFSFTSRDAAILLFEGLELELFFELPTFRKIAMVCRVAWVHATVSNHVKFGVQCMDINLDLHNGICAFLLLSEQWTPAKLRELGFRSQQVKSKLRFRTVKNMQDYAEVLYLRRDAYVGVGKKPEGTEPESMAGSLDGMSRILMAYHQETLVGSITFTYPMSKDVILDSEKGFPGQKYPIEIPPKVNLIEVSRLCIHQEYRSTDLLQGLFEHGIKHFLMSDRHWLLTSAVSELLPTYQRIGFKKLNVSYKHPGLNFKEHHLIIANRSAFLWGKGISPLVWNTLFGEVIEYLVLRKLIQVTFWEKIFIRGKLLFKPMAQSLLASRAQAAFRKHLKNLQVKGLLT